MSKVIIPPPTTYDEAAEQFYRVHQMKAAVVQEIEETGSGDQLLLIYDDGSPTRPGHAFLADRRDLVELARQILAALDPVTNEQLLEKMQGLVENHE